MLLSDNEVTANRGVAMGGDIFLRYAHHARLTGNRIYSNTSFSTTPDWPALGGGILVSLSDDIELIGNTVYNNMVQTPAGGDGKGGGITVSGGSRAILQGNVVYGNYANESSGGGLGGGVYLLWTNDIQMIGNTVYDNVASLL